MPSPTITNGKHANGKITPFFVVQFCLVLFAISAVVFRPGPWNAARLTGLCIAVPAAVLLFTARWQLGRSFSVTPQARELVTWGLYSRIRNPIYVFSALMLTGVLITLQYRYALLLLLVLIPVQFIRAGQEAKVLEGKFGEEYRKYREGTWF
jgi:protein-S-isoprenylcysteine O-methyltransferase Ste14